MVFAWQAAGQNAILNADLSTCAFTIEVTGTDGALLFRFVQK